MGLFDMVFVDCPHCGQPVEFQSKAAERPYMYRFTFEDAPHEVLVDILNSPEHCEHCGGWMALVDPNYPITPPRPKPQAVKVRPPENPTTHPQGMKWWPFGLPFTEADIVDEPPATSPGRGT